HVPSRLLRYSRPSGRGDLDAGRRRSHFSVRPRRKGRMGCRPGRRPHRQVGVCRMTDEEFHLTVHNMSMSQDYTEAAFGRFLKEILPRYRQLAEAEATRVNFEPGEYGRST